MLQLPAKTKRNYSIEKLSGIIAALKKEAKTSDSGLVTANIVELAGIGTAGIYFPGNDFRENSKTVVSEAFSH